MTRDTIKTAIVTGANKGIGFEISRKLGFAGFKVYMCGRDSMRIKQSCGLLMGEGHDVIPLILDVTKKESIAEAVEKVRTDGYKLHALVNNAAILLDDGKDLLDVAESDIIQTFNTNSIAPLMITKAFLPLMAENSRIVMLSSGAGAFCEEFSPWAPVYSTSKLMLNSFTRYLAPELSKKSIAINAVCPGWVKTDMGGSGADRDARQGAETPVWLATEVDISETGKFWRDRTEISW